MQHNISEPIQALLHSVDPKHIWINTKQTAGILDTTPETLAVRRCKKEYPTLLWKKRGRRVFYNLGSVIAFMAV